MATVEDVIVEIDADVSKLRKEVKAAEKSLDRFQKETKQSTKELTKLERQAKGTSSAMGGLGKVLAAGFALAGLRSVISATVEQERVIAQLEARIKSTGGAAGFTSQELQDMAASLQKVTTFGDEATIGMQSLLLTFTQISGKNFVAAQEAILNVATAMGTDLKSAALQVGKALNDPILGVTALARSGIQFSESQKDVIKDLAETGKVAEAQALILRELEIQFGGAARAAKDTFGGSLQALGNAFGDLLEGKSGLNQATKDINALTEKLSDPSTVEAADKLAGALIGIATGTANMLTEFANLGDQLAINAAALMGNVTEADRLKQEIKDVDRALDGSFLTTPLKHLADSEEDLKRLREELVRTREELLKGAGGSDTAAAIDPVVEGVQQAINKVEKFEQAFKDAMSKSADAAKEFKEALEEITNVQKERKTERGTTLDALITSSKAREALGRGDNSTAAKLAAEAAQQFGAIESRDGPQNQFGGFINNQASIASLAQATATPDPINEAQKTLKLEIDINGESRSFAFTESGVKQAGEYASELADKLKKADKTSNRTIR